MAQGSAICGPSSLMLHMCTELKSLIGDSRDREEKEREIREGEERELLKNMSAEERAAWERAHPKVSLGLWVLPQKYQLLSSAFQRLLLAGPASWPLQLIRPSYWSGMSSRWDSDKRAILHAVRIHSGHSCRHAETLTSEFTSDHITLHLGRCVASKIDASMDHATSNLTSINPMPLGSLAISIL